MHTRQCDVASEEERADYFGMSVDSFIAPAMKGFADKENEIQVQGPDLPVMR